MKETQENDKALSFVKRWVKAFNRILKAFGKKVVVNNSEFVDKILADEEANAKTQEEREVIEEKRQLLEELCADVDTYYQKLAEAEKAADLDDWFNGEVKSFVYDTIPDANEGDVKETEDLISKSMEEEIEVRTSLLESEFATEETKES